MSNIIEIPINLFAEKKYIINHIKSKCFKYNGLLFGEIVRDIIISDYYSKKFYDDINNKSELFWNEKIHPESFARTIIPEIINIFFKTYHESYLFIINILNKYNSFYINTSIINVNIISKQIKIKDIIGKTRLFKGYAIDLELNILYPQDPKIILESEPPFGNPNLACNLFVIEKNNIIRISQDVNNWYNKLSLIEKSIFVAKTLADIVKFKTIIVQKISLSNDCNKDIKEYIKIMMDPFKFTIKNLPYKVNICSKENNNCEICGLSLMKNEEIAIIEYKKIHHNCLIKYLEYQLNNCKPSLYFKNRYLYIIQPIHSFVSFNDCDIDLVLAEYIRI
jgi:hypothetical protein